MSDYAFIYSRGLLMGASLIIAIGAQNAFVLTQSIRRHHAHAVAGLYAFIDVILISAGVLGLGTLVANNEVLKAVSSLGGATFLIWFGLRSLAEARKVQSLTVDAGMRSSLNATLSATLAVSLLNPHVYLDTVVMLGAISGSYPGHGRYCFGLGAATASVLWFFSLSIAGRVLAPIFNKPRSWQILHILVAIMVWWVAAGLLRGYFGAA